MAPRTHPAAGLSQQSREGVPFKGPKPPSRTLHPHESWMPKTTQTHGSPKRAHPAPHPLGRMRPHFKATQERQQYEAAFPPAPPAAQCSRERGRSPPHSQPHIPSPSLTAGTPCRASCQCSRGRSDTRSSSSSRGAPVRSAPWQRPPRRGCCRARGCLGDGEEEAAESERGEAARPLPNQRKSVPRGFVPGQPTGRKLGGARKTSRQRAMGKQRCPTAFVLCPPSPCPSQTPSTPKPITAAALTGMIFAELFPPAETSLC